MKKKTKTSNISRILPVLIVALVAIAVLNQFVIMASPATGMVSKGPLLQGQYGVEYSEAGYQQLLQYDSSISLNSEQMKNYVGLDVELPCCGFAKLSAQNCGCGHHIALSGLAKLLASQGYSKAQIQGEIDNWKGVFFDGVGSGAMGSC